VAKEWGQEGVDEGEEGEGEVEKENGNDDLPPFIGIKDNSGYRRHLFSSQRGSLVLEPEAAKAGVRTCVFKGCSVPVVLCQREEHYELVGDHGVHGIMHGEAMDVMGNCGLNFEEIKIHKPGVSSQFSHFFVMYEYVSLPQACGQLNLP